jgi:hypothetical protein
MIVTIENILNAGRRDKNAPGQNAAMLNWQASGLPK